MLRLEIPGSWYADVAGVAGDYAALIPNSHIQTSRGRIELPHGENVLYLRAALGTHGMRLCGQGHQSGLAWLWDGAWGSHGPAHGVSPCIFDADSRLHIATIAQGSQGYRYVAPGDVLVTGDNTYNSQTPLAQSYGLERIWEWSHFGAITIGQGEACCLTIGPHGRRVLEPGDCRFVRVQCVGTAYAVAIVKQLEQKAVLLWFQADELATLPLEGVLIPDPEPDPDPHPDPEPSHMQYNTGPLNDYAQRRWQELPHGTRHEQAESLFRILHEFRTQTGDPIEVFRKGCTDTTFRGSDHFCYAEDICVINEGARGKWYKDVGMAFGASSARLDFGGEWLHPNGNDAAMCFTPPAPAGVDPDPEPDPDPQPDPQPSTLAARVAALEATVHGLQQNQTDPRAITMLKQQLDALNTRVELLRDTLSDGGTFDPNQWKVETPVKFIGTSIGTIKPKT